MKLQNYLAELVGTFALTFAVLISLALPQPVSTPMIAAITLGLFVYTIGHISGAHLNPAVTCGLISINKMKPQEGAFYIVSQFFGAMLAMVAGRIIMGDSLEIGAGTSFLDASAEALGTFFFTFGIAAVVYKKVPQALSGIVIGGSLLLGIFIASSVSNGVLNPAVALGIGSFNLMYILGPVAGSVAGMWCFKFLSDEK